jgi:hypothetical protein
MHFDIPVIEHPIALHPLDERRLRELSETLFEISAGRLMPSRKDLVGQIQALMMNTRRGCRVDGAEGVVDRLLGVADWRLGAEEIGNVILGEIAVTDVAQGQ